MKARAIDIIKFLSGNLTENHYVRVLNGELVIQRRPKRTKPATEAQIRARREFKEKYGQYAFSWRGKAPLERNLKVLFGEGTGEKY